MYYYNKFTQFIFYAKLYLKETAMAKKAEVKIFDNSNGNEEWEQEKVLTYEPMWELAYGANKQQAAALFKTEGMALWRFHN